MSKKNIEKELTKKFRQLIKRESECWYQAAKIAWTIYNKKVWEKLGYRSCKEYVEKEIPEISYEVFMYRVKMGECIARYEIPKEAIIDMGWSKFKDLASVLLMAVFPKEEREEYINQAKEMSARELQQWAKEKKAEIRGILESEAEALTQKVTFKFNVNKEAAEMIEEALHIAMKLADTSDMGVAFTYMAADFIMNYKKEATEEIKELIKEVSKRRIIRKPDVRNTTKKE